MTAGPRIAIVCAAFFFLYAVCFTVAFLDFDRLRLRPDIRAACPAFGPFVATLVLVALSQILPVASLSYHCLPAGIPRLAITAAWLLAMLALLVTACIHDRRLRDRPCFDEIYRPRAGQITGTAAAILHVAFLALLMQAVLAFIYAIFVAQDLIIYSRSQSAAPETRPQCTHP